MKEVKDSTVSCHEKRIFDIVCIFYLSKEVGWKGISKISVSRILYFITLFYTFVNPLKKNTFQELYRFSNELEGPICADVNSLVAELLSKKYLLEPKLLSKKEDVCCLNKDVYYLNTEEHASDIKGLLDAGDSDRFNWIKFIIYQLARHDGEKHLFDFMSQDPEFRRFRKNNCNIRFGSDSKTFEALTEFKEAFEDLNEIKLGGCTTIQLYFYFVFSFIYKGQLFPYEL